MRFSRTRLSDVLTHAEAYAAPARYRGNLVQPVALIKIGMRETAQAGSSVLDLVAFHQVGSQPVFRMGSDLAHRPTSSSDGGSSSPSHGGCG